MVGIEPTTYGLRNRCSATELHWRPRLGDDSSRILLGETFVCSRSRGAVERVDDTTSGTIVERKDVRENSKIYGAVAMLKFSIRAQCSFSRLPWYVWIATRGAEDFGAVQVP